MQGCTPSKLGQWQSWMVNTDCAGNNQAQCVLLFLLLVQLPLQGTPPQPNMLLLCSRPWVRSGSASIR